MKRVYTILDHAVDAGGSLFLAETDAEAIRAMTSACWDPASMYNVHAEDYSLMCVGAWDPRTLVGEFQTPVKVAGLAMIRDLKRAS